MSIGVLVMNHMILRMDYLLKNCEQTRQKRQQTKVLTFCGRAKKFGGFG
jgi:hypothetical protein